MFSFADTLESKFVSTYSTLRKTLKTNWVQNDMTSIKCNDGNNHRWSVKSDEKIKQTIKWHLDFEKNPTGYSVNFLYKTWFIHDKNRSWRRPIQTVLAVWQILSLIIRLSLKIRLKVAPNTSRMTQCTKVGSIIAGACFRFYYRIFLFYRFS